MPELIWTKQPPTVPGWYWWRAYGAIAVMEVCEQDGEMIAQNDGCWFKARFADGEWAGPLTLPKEPADA